MKYWRPAIKLFLLLVSLFAVDRLFKYYVFYKLVDNQGGFFYFTFKINSQAVFNLPLANWLIMIISLLILFMVIGLIINWWPKLPWLSRLGGLIIFSGGFSNLLDRWYWGGVIDVFAWGNMYFNLSDVYIISGVGLIIWSERHSTWFKKIFTADKSELS